MKKFSLLALFVLTIGTVGPLATWAQSVGGVVEGNVTDGGKPVADAQIVLTNEQGRTYKAKTDKNGYFQIAGVGYGNYDVKVLNKNGEVIDTERTGIGTGDTSTSNVLTIKIGEGGATGDKGAPSSSSGGSKTKMTKEQIKAEQDKVASLNALIGQAQAAMQAQKWTDAEATLKQVIAAQPDTTKWELYKALGDSQRMAGHLDDSIQSYDKGIQVAQSIVDGKAPKDPRNPNPDPARAKAGMGTMITAQGNVYVRQGKIDAAIAAFAKGAAIDPNPALAYYNLCALQFNAGKYEDAAAACDKSTAADANKADAWFFKGAALNKAGKPGSAEALNKYLQLDANGAHAAEAKTLLTKAN